MIGGNEHEHTSIQCRSGTLHDEHALLLCNHLGRRCRHDSESVAARIARASAHTYNLQWRLSTTSVSLSLWTVRGESNRQLRTDMLQVRTWLRGPRLFSYRVPAQRVLSSNLRQLTVWLRHLSELYTNRNENMHRLQW